MINLSSQSEGGMEGENGGDGGRQREGRGCEVALLSSLAVIGLFARRRAD